MRRLSVLRASASWNLKHKAQFTKMPPRPQLTHFLCLPLVTEKSRPIFEQALRTFSEDVFGSGLIPEEVSERAVRPAGTLHLTLGVMSLVDQERLDAAIQLLQDVDLKELLENAEQAAAATRVGRAGAQEVDGNLTRAAASISVDEEETNTKALTVSLRSLQPMQKQTKTSVLYAPPTDQTNRLRPFAESLRDLFQQAGLVIDENRPLKLHATILNTIYGGKRRGKVKGKGKGARGSAPVFDSTDIVQRYEDFAWIQGLRIERVAICKMGAKKIEDEEGDVISEEYEELATKEMPV